MDKFYVILQILYFLIQSAHSMPHGHLEQHLPVAPAGAKLDFGPKSPKAASRSPRSAPKARQLNRHSFVAKADGLDGTLLQGEDRTAHLPEASAGAATAEPIICTNRRRRCARGPSHRHLRRPKTRPSRRDRAISGRRRGASYARTGARSRPRDICHPA